MNREIKRILIQNGEIKKIVDKLREDARRDAYREAFAAMLLACHKEEFFDYARIRNVVVATLQYISATECAAELVGMLKGATGFDVDAPLDAHVQGMEVE